MRNQKGITLIALVITIIVLLILAGVSIAMLAGDNGVLTKASDSKIVNALGAKKDEVVLIASEAVSDYYEAIYVNNVTSTYTPSELQGVISDKIDNAALSDDEILVEVDGNNIKLTSKSKDTLYTEGEITDKGAIDWDDHFKNE